MIYFFYLSVIIFQSMTCHDSPQSSGAVLVKRLSAFPLVVLQGQNQSYHCVSSKWNIQVNVSLQWLYREVAWPRSGKVSILVFFDWSIKWRQMFSVNHKGNELRVVSKINYDKQLPGNLSLYSQSYSNHLCTVTDLNMLQQRYKERWWWSS